MKCYQQIAVNNLDLIVEKAMALFPEKDQGYTHLFYIENSVDKFLDIPELASELKRLGYYDYVFSVAFFIVMPGAKSPIHLDSGDTVFSFNIPLRGCKGTNLNFYSCKTEPTANVTEQGKIFYSYAASDCELVDSYEMTVPTVINVKIPHGIVNNNPAISEPRITLLIRLKQEIGELF